MCPSPNTAGAPDKHVLSASGAGAIGVGTLGTVGEEDFGLTQICMEAITYKVAGLRGETLPGERDSVMVAVGHRPSGA